MSVSSTFFERSRNVRWDFVFLFAVLFALNGCGGGGSSDRERIPDPDPVPDPEVLTLFAPVISGALIAGMPRELQLHYAYDQAVGGEGPDALRFALEEAPPGMTLLEDTGTLLWTPSPALEGSEHTVRVRAELGNETAEVTFPVTVALSTPMATDLVGDTLTVMQPGSLRDFAITVPDRASLPLDQIQVGMVDEVHAPPLPERAVRLSDFFVVSPVTVDEGAMTVSLPSKLVPSGMHVEDLSLFVFNEAVVRGSWDPDAAFEPRDSASWAAIGSNFAIMADALEFEVSALGAMSFIGYYLEPEGTTGVSGAWEPETRILASQEPVDAESRCQPQRRPDGSPSQGIWECEADGFELQVRRLAPDNWGADNVDNILAWTIEARAEIQNAEMNADNQISVSIQPLADNAMGEWRFETPNALYIGHELPSQLGLPRADVAKYVLAHEFFHHAQFRTGVEGPCHMFNLPASRRDWVVEGTAVWFEDEVYDDLNSYRAFSPPPTFLSRIGGRGLGTASSREAYGYFAWWKMLNTRCDGFSIRDVLSIAADDSWGVANLADRVNSSAWNCKFTPGFEDTGRPGRRFASALLYYAYATDSDERPDALQVPIDLGRLDPGEPEIDFWTIPPNAGSVTPSQHCNDVGRVWPIPLEDDCPRSAANSFVLGTATAPKASVAAIPETAGTTAIFYVDNYSTVDLYVFFVQTDLGWPNGKGYWVAPEQRVTVQPALASELLTPYHGGWNVFFVNPDAESILTASLIAGVDQDRWMRDEDVRMDWFAGERYCSEKGGRLPTWRELQAAWEDGGRQTHPNRTPGFEGWIYWTDSGPDADSEVPLAGTFVFTTGMPSGSTPTIQHSVRCKY